MRTRSWMSSVEFAPNIEALVGAESTDDVDPVSIFDHADGSALTGTIDDRYRGDDGVELEVVAESISPNKSLP